MIFTSDDIKTDTDLSVVSQESIRIFLHMLTVNEYGDFFVIFESCLCFTKMDIYNRPFYGFFTLFYHEVYIKK